MNRRRRSFGTVGGGFAGLNCGFCIGILIFNLTIGALCFDYSLRAYFGKDVHWVADTACGLVLGEFVVPAAIVGVLLDWGGLEQPYFASTPPPAPVLALVVPPNNAENTTRPALE